jgi:hypothetical protein
MGAGAILVVALWAFCLAFWACSSGFARGLFAEIRRLWRSMGVPGRVIAIIAVVCCVQSGGSKGVSPVARVMRLLYWAPGSQWQLLTAHEAAVEAASSASAATGALARAETAATNISVYTISFGWHAPQRLPYHARQNVLSYTPLVVATNIDDVLYEDHYVAFNAVASTNPAVILIEYAKRLDSGEIERRSSSVVTSSFPDTATVQLQSGSYTCYWFRCAVPPGYANAVRDWNGEALFGSPAGSGAGFDLLGTLVVDDGDDVWAGANTNMVVGAATNIVRNGVITED